VNSLLIVIEKQKIKYLISELVTGTGERITVNV